MNNAQFRKLLETPRADRPSTSTSNAAPSATPAVLGSRQRSAIPMTPRSLTTGNTDFARQLAAHRAAQQPTKKFRSSAAPKGTKLAAGYVDRAKARSEQEQAQAVEDERVARLEALEKLYKDGLIEQEEYVRQTKLLGGDVTSTHLVKGLDFALLERVRKGEDVMSGGRKGGGEGEEEEEEEDLEDRLDKVLEQEVAPVERKKEKKKGVAAPKSRAEILAELKAARQAAKEAANPALGSKFRKIGEPKKNEKEEEEREEKVRHVIGPDGRVKKKVKRSDKERREKQEMPPPASAPLGMMPPPPLPGAKSKPALPEPEEDDDIFDGVGDYDPLAGLNDDDDSSSDESTKGEKAAKDPDKAPDTTPDKPLETNTQEPPAPADPSMPPPPRPKRKLFDDDDDEPTSSTTSASYAPPSSASSLLASDPSLAAALAKAAKIGTKLVSKEEEEREKRRKAMQEANDRDAYDIDFGFGGSRDFGEDDDEEYTGKTGGRGGSGGNKRKRGPKKRKGDKNDAETVGRVVEERYGKK